MKNPLNMNELKNYDLWNKKRYDNREDKDNIFPIGIDDKKFVEIIRDIFLGSDWYVVMPLGHNQINEEILEEIIYKITGKSAKERCK